jgi:phosphoglycolate phosphatase-like HAD superfamily hydrolase
VSAGDIIVALVGVARNLGSPEDLRQAGADMVVADLQELLGSAKGLDR